MTNRAPVYPVTTGIRENNVRSRRFSGGVVLAVIISMAAGAINVNALNRGSVVAVGEISQPGWNQSGKTNFGNGQLFGSNLATGFVATIFDNDVIDNPINEIEPAPSIQSQVL